MTPRPEPVRGSNWPPTKGPTGRAASPPRSAEAKTGTVLALRIDNWSERRDTSSGEYPAMAVSHYKGQWIGKLPMCAICGGAGDGPRAEHRLTHGVSVWLCEAHRGDAFQQRRGGRDFVASLAAVWRAAGVSNRRHAAAMTAHLRRVRGDRRRDRPGSYAWPHLRREAERRFASGEQPAEVERDLARHCAARAIRCPSRRTLRRWFHEGRWLHARSQARSSRPAAAPTSEAARGANEGLARRRIEKASNLDREPPAD